jgi:hypothetical protein
MENHVYGNGVEFLGYDHVGDTVLIGWNHPSGPIVGMIATIVEMPTEPITKGKVVVKDLRSEVTVEIPVAELEVWRGLDGMYETNAEVEEQLGEPPSVPSAER